MYKPKPFSIISGLVGYLVNKLPKFLSPDSIAASGEGREGISIIVVVRV